MFRLLAFCCFHGGISALQCEDVSRAAGIAKVIQQIRQKGLDPVECPQIIEAAKRAHLTPQQYVHRYSSSAADTVTTPPPQKSQVILINLLLLMRTYLTLRLVDNFSFAVLGNRQSRFVYELYKWWSFLYSLCQRFSFMLSFVFFCEGFGIEHGRTGQTLGRPGQNVFKNVRAPCGLKMLHLSTN